jgi:hypothetical protein
MAAKCENSNRIRSGNDRLKGSQMLGKEPGSDRSIFGELSKSG